MTFCSSTLTKTLYFSRDTVPFTRYKFFQTSFQRDGKSASEMKPKTVLNKCIVVLCSSAILFCNNSILLVCFIKVGE